MADFKQAIEWLKKGKKVRRKNWAIKNLYCKYSKNVWDGSKMRKGIFFFEGDSNQITTEGFSFCDFEATDWEIYCEEKPKECKPNLGCATTRQLIDEVKTRVEMDGKLNYRTIDSD